MKVELISITPDAEKTMAHIARVSNPNNQDNPKYAGLLKYCIKHNHWSVFEQSSMTLEITLDTLKAEVYSDVDSYKSEEDYSSKPLDYDELYDDGSD